MAVKIFPLDAGFLKLSFWNGKIRSIPGALLLVMAPLFLFAQLSLKDQISKYRNWERFNVIDRFYQNTNYEPAWIYNAANEADLVRIIRNADSFGLRAADYQYSFLSTYKPGQIFQSGVDSADADIRFTEAAIHFFTELKFGNKTPSFAYMGLQYNPAAASRIPEDLLMHLKNGSLDSFVSSSQLNTKEYLALIKKLNWFRYIISDSNFKEAKITSKTVDGSNKALLIRLYQLGITDSVLKSPAKKLVAEKLRLAQNLFDLLSDGVLRSTTLAALNVSLKKRLEEIKTALNYLRWTAPIKQNSSVLLLNIPSACLMVYDRGTIVVDSKVVVGKPSTPTPTLTSTITDVILYPFWNVPHKIATKELLPSIKRDIGFLERGNYQVLNSQGRVLNPYKINWKSLSTGYFPYKIRQSTGCDNALGVVKFDFYNPFTVYLHDTPSKGLFSFNKRYFSHGCMRVEKPIELAHILLGRNRIAIDTLTAKGCLNQQVPKPVSVEKQLPVMVMYSTVWYNKEGEIRFYDDVYGKIK